MKQLTFKDQLEFGHLIQAVWLKQTNSKTSYGHPTRFPPEQILYLPKVSKFTVETLLVLNFGLHDIVRYLC